MPFELMQLPFAENALEPHMSAETLSYHYGKHHAAYVNKLNALSEGTEFAGRPLVEIIKNSQGGIYNNAAQVFNHDFFWHSLSPEHTAPSAELAEMIDAQFGSMEGFKKVFTDAAASLFGSGWVWLTVSSAGRLRIEKYANAGNPIGKEGVPLFTCDVWEHAYYIDYRNARPGYLEGFWKLLNWQFASRNLAEAREKRSYYYIHECNDDTQVCDYVATMESQERVSS